MMVKVVTTIVSTVESTDGENILAQHLIDMDGPDDMPESLLRAIARSAASTLIAASEVSETRIETVTCDVNAQPHTEHFAGLPCVNPVEVSEQSDTDQQFCPTCGQPDNCGDCTHEPVSRNRTFDTENPRSLSDCRWFGQGGQTFDCWGRVGFVVDDDADENYVECEGHFNNKKAGA